MEKIVKKEVKKTSKRKEVFSNSEQIENSHQGEYSDNMLIEELIYRFTSKQNKSENILVCIQHLESILKLSEKEILNIEVLDSEVV